MIAMKKIFLVVFTIYLLLLTGTLSSATIFGSDLIDSNTIDIKEIKSHETTADWTLMHYLSFDTQHTTYEIDMKLENLSKVGSTDDINIIVATDGIDYGDSAIYYIQEGNPVNVNDLFNWPEEVDMGDSNTIKTFIELAKENYPANHYAIIFYTDYGSGWQGVCRDTNGGLDTGLPLMTITELADAFKEITNNGDDRFDLVGIMTCISGSFETAYELSPYVDYIVFSEEHMLEPLDKGPEYIFQYLDATWYLKNNTDATPEQYATEMVELYNPCDFPLWVFYTYEIIYKKGEISPLLKLLSNKLTEFLNARKNPEHHVASIHTTLSAINLSRVSDVKTSLNNLASKLILYLEDNDVKNSIDDARRDVRSYGHFYPKTNKNSRMAMIFLMNKMMFDSYVDLYNLVELIHNSVDSNEIKDLCLQVMEKIDDSVVKKASVLNDDSNGYTIYFPKEKSLYDKYIWSDEAYPGYENLKFSKDCIWDEFLKKYLEV